jgi:hypothetical protein
MVKIVEVNKKDLEKLLDYVRDAESEDFENTEIGCRAGHIYKVIIKLDKLVDKNNRSCQRKAIKG